jgi:cobalt/nickel transport protein
MRRQNLLLALAVVALAVLPLVTIRPGDDGEAVFGGTDDRGAQLAASLRPEYQRWATPVWEPPSAEVASLLFGVQAAIGAGALGYCLGYWRGRRRTGRRGDDARD